MIILKKPSLKFLFRNHNSFREVSVSGNIRLEESNNNCIKERLIKGRIDLLHITENKILIVDFKSNPKVPASIELVSPLILSQLELYTLLLEQAYPSREVVSAILWTHNAELMEVPRNVSQDALTPIFINQVLDDVQARS